MEPVWDLTTTQFVFPPDAKLLPVDELAPRLRAKIGPVDGDQVVVTRPGFRMTTRLVTASLAALLTEFRRASLVTEAVRRFSKSYDQNAMEVLDLCFDALVTFINGRTLVSADSADAHVSEPSLAAGQAIDDMEVEHLVRSLDDTEVYRVRTRDGRPAALKIARDNRAEKILSHEANILDHLNGQDCPALLDQGSFSNRRWLAMEWCDGVSIAVAAQQARASGERGQLYQLALNLLEAYSRIHDCDVVHGDIHTGNVLVSDSGKITILDFGRARLLTDSKINDPNRAGIAHYYDPQMAAAILAEKIPPAASRASEQYALATLVYILLTGLPYIDSPAEQSELLRRIVSRPMLPFAMQGVDAWPSIEEVLQKALAKEEKDRYPTTSAFTFAFSRADGVSKDTENTRNEIEKIVFSLKNIDSFTSTRITPHVNSWLALRGSLACSDPELLAIADLWCNRCGKSLEEYWVTAAVARARSDRRAVRKALEGFVVEIDKLTDINKKCQAVIHASHLIQGTDVREYKLQNIVEWLEDAYLDSKYQHVIPESLFHAAMALAKAGVISLPENLFERLKDVEKGSFWYWALAYEVFQKAEFLESALSTTFQKDMLSQGLAYLRLHQLTGKMHWIDEASRISTCFEGDESEVGNALLIIELEMPSRMVRPYFQT